VGQDQDLIDVTHCDLRVWNFHLAGAPHTRLVAYQHLGPARGRWSGAAGAVTDPAVQKRNWTICLSGPERRRAEPSELRGPHPRSRPRRNRRPAGPVFGGRRHPYPTARRYPTGGTLRLIERQRTARGARCNATPHRAAAHRPRRAGDSAQQRAPAVDITSALKSPAPENESRPRGGACVESAVPEAHPRRREGAAR